MKLIKTKKQLDKAFDNIESGKSSLIIRQATNYANLSQWIQMEIWKYVDEVNSYRDASESADRIIKRCNKELITKIKKSLPTHSDGMITRNEVKKILDRL